MSFILHLFRTLEDILKVHIKNGYDSFVPKKFIKKKLFLKFLWRLHFISASSY